MYVHHCNLGDDCPEFDQDPFISAVIAFEVANDDYKAAAYRQSLVDHGGSWTSTTIAAFKAVNNAEARMQRAQRVMTDEAIALYGNDEWKLDNMDDVIPLLRLV